MTGDLPHNLRSDAKDNRDRIIAAARVAFAEGGLDVPMREIARRAGVGPATLYRRFPTKEALIAESFEEQMTACVDVVEEGLVDPDPWLGFCHVVEKLCAMHVEDCGFTAAFLSMFPHAIDLAAAREQALRRLGQLARRAKAAGRLRTDFVVDDLLLVLMASSGIRAATPAATAAASRRFAALLIQGFRADSSAPALPRPVRLPLATASRVG
jgi:AcrR family transcriptional regulator